MEIRIPDAGQFSFDDANAHTLVDARLPTGMLLRDQHPQFAAYGSVPWFSVAEEVLPTKIPRSEWKDRIDEMWAKEMWPMCYCDFKCRSQDSTNFCWSNGPATGVDIVRRMQGLPHVETSAASVACPVNGYVNRGGWGIDACTYMQAKGACSSAIWPNAAISHAYDKAADPDRPNRRVLEFTDIPKQDFDYLATFLFDRHPCPVGYNWWGHEVCAVALKYKGTGAAAFPYAGTPDFLLTIRNSWQNAQWGYEYKGFIGYGDLSESRGTPDDAQAVRAVTTYAG